jgi:hypothetical protein
MNFVIYPVDYYGIKSMSIVTKMYVEWALFCEIKVILNVVINFYESAFIFFCYVIKLKSIVSSFVTLIPVLSRVT